MESGEEVEAGPDDAPPGQTKLPQGARPEPLVSASGPHVLGLWTGFVVSQMVENAVAVPEIHADGLLSGTKELQKAISMWVCWILP